MGQAIYVTGILIAASVLLMLGTVFTWLELSEYGNDSAAPATPVVAPSEAPAGSPAQPEEAAEPETAPEEDSDETEDAGEPAEGDSGSADSAFEARTANLIQ